MFKLQSISCEIFMYPTKHTQWYYFCWTLYFRLTGHVSVITMQFCCCSVKAATDNK